MFTQIAGALVLTASLGAGGVYFENTDPLDSVFGHVRRTNALARTMSDLELAKLSYHVRCHNETLEQWVARGSTIYYRQSWTREVTGPHTCANK